MNCRGILHRASGFAGDIRKLVVVSLPLAAAFSSGAAFAQDVPAGTWKIASSEPAPWPHALSWEVPAQIKRLVGATVVLRADRIQGPKPLACKKANFKIEQYSADMLFQGTLAEKGNARTTPDNQATALGFTQRPIPSLTTSCESGVEFHMIDQDHMLFGLDNRVYRMVRDTSARASKPANHSFPRVSQSALIEATKATMLSAIASGRELCDADRSVEAWLKDVVGDTGAHITWRGGGCLLTNKLNASDAGSKWCGGATIVPKDHPGEISRIEVYFEEPVGGKPGQAYAFRGFNYVEGGAEYVRFFPEFEYGYRQGYQQNFARPEQRDCD